MGFNFDKSSQDGGGGGKIRRKTFVDYPGFIEDGSTPTSPLYIYNNTVNVVSRFRSPFELVSEDITGTGLYTFSLSVGSNTWIDMIGFEVSGEDLTMRTIYINGKSPIPFTPFQVGYGDTNTNFGFFDAPLDVYGYSLSATAYIYANTGGQATTPNGAFYLMPFQPRTLISTSGAVQYPEALSGYSVIRDI